MSLPVVVMSAGKVMLTAAGLVKLSSVSPPTGDCCCEVEQTCCPERDGSFPATLTMSVTGRDGCECFAQDVVLSNVFNAWYLGNLVLCNASTTGVSLTCEDGGAWWRLAMNLCFGSRTITLLSCDPIHLLMENVELTDLSTGCCQGFVDIEITE